MNLNAKMFSSSVIVFVIVVVVVVVVPNRGRGRHFCRRCSFFRLSCCHLSLGIWSSRDSISQGIWVTIPVGLSINTATRPTPVLTVSPSVSTYHYWFTVVFVLFIISFIRQKRQSTHHTHTQTKLKGRKKMMIHVMKFTHLGRFRLHSFWVSLSCVMCTCESEYFLSYLFVALPLPNRPRLFPSVGLVFLHSRTPSCPETKLGSVLLFNSYLSSHTRHCL